METSTIIINEADLNYASVTVRADSYVAYAERYNTTCGVCVACILVDGIYYDIVRLSDTVDNPALVAAFNAAMDRVEAAVKALQAPTAETICITDILDDLTAAADQVRAEAAPEWTSALDAGWSWLLEQDTFQIDAHGSLLVPSSRNTANVYRANGICQCEAYTKANGSLPCYHRGAGMIVERWRENTMLELQAQREERDRAQREYEAYAARVIVETNADAWRDRRARAYEEIAELFG